jgi:4-hydroxybenzoate polyprenyltransferase
MKCEGRRFSRGRRAALDRHGARNARSAVSLDVLVGRSHRRRMRVTARSRVPAFLSAAHASPTLAVTTIAALLAAAVGHGAARVSLISAAVLAGQLSIGWSNDWLDAERDVAIGRMDKPVASGRVAASQLGWAAGAAAVACLFLSLAVGLHAGSIHLVAVAAGWAYNCGLKATVASFLPYVIAFGLLPVFIIAALPGSPASPTWLPAAGALIGAGAHFADVLPDVEGDLATGVRGLGQRLGKTRCAGLAALLLVAAIGVLVFGPSGQASSMGLTVLGATTIGAGIGFRLGRRAGSRAFFGAIVVIAIAAVLLLAVSGALLP